LLARPLRHDQPPDAPADWALDCDGVLDCPLLA